MGTKAKPGAFDCHARAEDDEPMFTLVARDPDAPALIEQWARMRTTRLRASGRLDFKESAKIDEALLVAKEMRAWHLEHRPEAAT